MANGGRAKQPGLMYTPGVQSKILLRLLIFSILLKDERFGSKVDLQQTLSMYAFGKIHLSTLLKDEHFDSANTHR